VTFDLFAYLRAIEDSDLPGLTRAVLSILARSANRAGMATGRDVSQAALIRRSGYSRNGVLRAVSTAQAAGWLDRETPGDGEPRRSGRCNFYRLHAPVPVDNSEKQSPGGTGSAPNQSSPGTGTSPSEGLDQSLRGTPEDPSFDLDTSSLLRVRTVLAEVLPDLTDDDELRALLDKIRAEYPAVRNLPGWLRVVGTKGDLHVMLMELRHGSVASGHASPGGRPLPTDELAAARFDPALMCEHGTAGGRHRRSDTGTLLCALCRLGDTAADTVSAGRQ